MTILSNLWAAIWAFFLSQVWTRGRNLFSLATTLINVLVFNGTHMEPLSARCYRQASSSRAWFWLMFAVNSFFALFGQSHHCRGSYSLMRETATEIAQAPGRYPGADSWKP